MAEKIPKFKTDKEEAEFWNTRSSVDFLDGLLEVKESIELSDGLRGKSTKRVKEPRFLFNPKQPFVRDHLTF